MEGNLIQIYDGITIVNVEMSWNPATCSCKNGKYLASFMDDSAVTCDGIIES